MLASFFARSQNSTALGAFAVYVALAITHTHKKQAAFFFYLFAQSQIDPIFASSCEQIGGKYAKPHQKHYKNDTSEPKPSPKCGTAQEPKQSKHYTDPK
ncbi:MAG: hypothetical protein J6R40_02935 [Clostridia bacterium]|nr:hypothetical protein [Clostridia bacterium]